MFLLESSTFLKGIRAKSKLLFNVFMFLPPKHRKPHAWIREQRSKSAHLPDPTHAGTKYPRSGEPLTPTLGFVHVEHGLGSSMYGSHSRGGLPPPSYCCVGIQVNPPQPRFGCCCCGGVTPPTRLQTWCCCGRERSIRCLLMETFLVSIDAPLASH